jgi:hypothetical protein
MRRKTYARFVDGLRTLIALAFLALVALAAAGCSSVPTGVAALAGRYELRSVDGHSIPDDRLGGAIGGELVLTTDGRATRTVQYATSGIPGPITRRASGSYGRRGDEVNFVLVREGLALPEATWEIRGEARPPRITLRYPGPAASMVVEEYVRTP